MRPLRAVTLVALPLALATNVQAQSLAEVARRAALQRRAGRVATRAYTNRDLSAGTQGPLAAHRSDASAGPVAGPRSPLAAAAAAATRGVSAQSATPSQGGTPAASPSQAHPQPVAPAATTMASSRPWGRIAFFTNTAQIKAEGREDRSYTEFVTTVSMRSRESATTAVEYGVDTRLAGYSGLERDARVSVYDAWVGARLMGGALRVRGGQMWIADLGGLGAVAGGLVEYRRPVSRGTLRLVGFGGLEPKSYEAGYVDNVTRYGGYAAFDASALQRHVVGYVMVRDAQLTERSVLTSTNYVPIGKQVFFYQALEYDLAGPGGAGKGGLTYFFLNGRASATPRVEVQGSYHRGRSVDARSITTDLLNGRPVPARALEGLLFESAGGRVTVRLPQGVRAYVGYARDKNNRDSDATDRLTFGGSASNVARTGIDATVSVSRVDRRSVGSYDSWYVSVGRGVGRRLYLTGDYTSSLSVLRFTGGDGFLVETRPETHRVSLTSLVHLGRSWSLLATVERTDDQSAEELRLLTGLSYRLP